MTSNAAEVRPAGHRAPAAPRVRARRSGRWSRWDIKYSPYLYVAPFFLLFAAFGLFPILYTSYASLYHWSLLESEHSWRGLANYVDVLTDDLFWNATYNTFGMFVLATLPQLVLALALANLLNRRLRMRTALRMGILVPNITSVAAVGIVFGLLFADRYGLINWILDSVGLPIVEWRVHRWSSWLAIATMVDWRWTGYNALIYLAAMQAIPRDLYESAALDGASPWRQFWRITVPLIRPTLLFTVIISTIGGMQLFTEPLLFGYGQPRGGGQNEYQTIAMRIYETTFTRNFDVGRGAAMSWLLFLFILILALINFALVRRSVKGETR
jgi:cellobiose transport system permease protein